ncbi:M28 family peptidase [Candidatus Lokiarchaeum ossiferum]|uniref:M28 family peptidase n=1 Tax=Candidatus Lokiarchaeum ossiferum TaxID=2951803 RepID=UPI00352FB6A0
MSIPSLMEKVDIENLYQHVLRLEGIRHPIQHSQHLKKSQDYIYDTMKSYGLQIIQQSFHLKPFLQDFSNIQGMIVNESEPIILITSHYDTVFNSPGAMDNAGAVAIMLECARILSEQSTIQNVGFVAFTLEEFNASWVLARNNKLIELGLYDEKFRWTTYGYAKKMLHYKKQIWQYRQQGLTAKQSIEQYLNLFSSNISSSIRSFIEFDLDLNKNYDHMTIWGNSALYGSEKWFLNRTPKDNPIEGVLNIDAVGFRSFSNSPHSAIKDFSSNVSQSPKKPLEIKSLPKIQIIANQSSKCLMDQYCNCCTDYHLDLEIIKSLTKKNLEEIARTQPDLMRSDHTTFWKRNIPAIFITDFTEVPNPYYHSAADTIDKIDFDILKTLTQATLGTIKKLKKNFD